MAAIELRDVTKTYGDYVAVDKLTLNVPENGVFGLLGTNGAGKTTTIHLLTGLLLPDSGSVTILGMNALQEIESIRKHIAFVPQTISLYENLTIQENLDFFGGLYLSSQEELNKKIEEFIALFGLEHKRNVRISSLSGGYQRRCSIACAVMTSPKILFLDEPLSGIDMQTNTIIMQFLRSLKETTIILTTHSITQAESLCEYVVFLDKGKKLLEGKPKDIVDDFALRMGETITVQFDKDVNVDKVFTCLKKARFTADNLSVSSFTISFTTTDLGGRVVEVIDALVPVKKYVLNIDISKPTLEDIFNTLTKGKL